MILKKKRLIIAALFTITGFIIGLIISSNFNFQSTGYAGEITISKESIDVLSKTNIAIAEIAYAVKPSVVNISSTKMIKSPGNLSPFSNAPNFKRFF